MQSADSRERINLLPRSTPESFQGEIASGEWN
jgi:hypothetical protein